MDEKVKETLEKQLQLLSERSSMEGSNLAELTYAMCNVANLLNERNPIWS